MEKTENLTLIANYYWDEKISANVTSLSLTIIEIVYSYHFIVNLHSNFTKVVIFISKLRNELYQHDITERNYMPRYEEEDHLFIVVLNWLCAHA